MAVQPGGAQGAAARTGERMAEGPGWAAPDWAAPDWTAADSPARWAPTTAAPPTLGPRLDQPAAADTRGGQLAPSLLPLRPLGVGELLDGAFLVLRHRARTVYTFSAIVLTTSFVITVALPLASGTGFAGFSARANESLSGLSVAALSTTSVLNLFITASFAMLLTGLLAVVVGETLLGRSPSAREVWGRVRPVLPALLLAAIVAGALPYVGLVFLVVPGVLLWAVLGLLTPVVVLERLGLRAAFRRTLALGRGDLFRLLAIRLLGNAISSAVAYIVIVPFVVLGVVGASGNGSDVGGPLVAVVVLVLTFLATLLVQPFEAALLALLYLDRRMRAEALDLVLREQGPAGVAHPTAAALG